MVSSRSKLGKHSALLGSEVAYALPETRRLRKDHFETMLGRYGAVIVKPTGGYGGAGVVSVKAVGGDRYEVHYGKRKKQTSGISSAYTLVRRVTEGRGHLVQRKIALASIGGRPFDLRVMVQRKRGKSAPWTVTGKLAKVAGAGYVITNIRRSGGKVMSFPAAIRASDIPGAYVPALESRVDNVALAAARQLRKRYKVRICGLDIGLDREGNVWIIEANFTPDLGLFRKLKDQSAYRRILQYAK